jgi:hypothetical protein
MDSDKSALISVLKKNRLAVKSEQMRLIDQTCAAKRQKSSLGVK